MPAIYAQTVLPAIRDCLADGQHSVTSLLDRVFVQELPESELRLLDADLGSLFSLNSPDLLDRARQCISCN
jgi:molybdopterin-guanine dinucleotide biosynthesis protein A